MGIYYFFGKGNTSFIPNKYIICGIFLSFAAVTISYARGDWVFPEYDRKFFSEEINYVVNNQYQVQNSNCSVNLTHNF